MYNFSENKLPQDFASEKIAKITELIEKSVSFTLLSLPGLGISQFLRFFVSSQNYHFIYLDMRALTDGSKLNFYKLLLKELGEVTSGLEEQDLYLHCQKKLEELTLQQHRRVVIVFNKFTTHQELLDFHFFSNLRQLRSIDPEKIVIIFTGNKPLVEVLPDAVSGPNINFLIYNHYFGRFLSEDILKLAPLYIPHFNQFNKEQINTALHLANGHINLFSLVLNSRSQKIIDDKLIQSQLEDILNQLTYKQKEILKRISLRKNVFIEEKDPLIESGIIVKKTTSYQLFSPLLQEYLLKKSYTKLPVKESKLYALLKKNIGKVVTKDQLFATVWEDPCDDNATDWALNALIYRLKKNPIFKQKGYLIKNEKKIGYRLVKEV